MSVCWYWVFKKLDSYGFTTYGLIVTKHMREERHPCPIVSFHLVTTSVAQLTYYGMEVS